MADLLKHCRKCGTDKPVVEFYKDKSRTDGLTHWCKDCQRSKHVEYDRSDYRRQYYEDNKTKFDENSRRVHLKKYGITPEEYAELLFLQGGVCKICGGQSKGDRRLAVDHCHTTGKIRGLLCNTCNAGLGQFGDNVELLRKAITYLEGSDS